jgi:hypothetical protein
MFNPPITGNKDLDAYLYDLSLNLDGNTGATESNPDIPGGDPGSYTYQYIHVKYATDNVGTGFSNTPTNKTYFGIYNSDSSTESTNPADYTWYLSGFPFGTTYFLYYLILGGRKIKFAVNTSPPDYHWKVDDGNAIDLDIIVPASTISLNEILNGAVTELKIAANAVTATKINVAALDQAFGDLRPNTVSAAQIATNAVTNLKLLDGAVTAAKTAVASIDSATGNLTANSVGSTQITDNAITSQKITANAITAGKIAANAIVASNIQAGTITGDKIFANTITGDNIAALTIGAQAIAAQAITAVKIETGAIVADKIAADAVTSAKITTGAITALKVATGAITADKIAASAITADKIAAGTIWTNNLQVGTSPAISGSTTTMTGSGAVVNSNGTFALGNGSTNITYNGSTMYLNGNVVSTGNLNSNSVTVPANISAYLGGAVNKNGPGVWQDVGGVSTTYASTPDAVLVTVSLNLFYMSGSGTTASFVRVTELNSGISTLANGITHTNSTILSMTINMTGIGSGARSFMVQIGQETGGPSFIVGNASLTTLATYR